MRPQYQKVLKKYRLDNLWLIYSCAEEFVNIVTFFEVHELEKWARLRSHGRKMLSKVRNHHSHTMGSYLTRDGVKNQCHKFGVHEEA